MLESNQFQNFNFKNVFFIKGFQFFWIFLGLAIYICSCDIVDEYNFEGIEYDTVSQFNWTAYSNNVGTTNDMFILFNRLFTAGSAPAYFNNTSFTPLTNEKLNETFCLDGINELKLFLGSSLIDVYGIEKGLLYYWNGTNTINFEVPDDNSGKIIDIYIENFDRTWINTSKGNFVYKFENYFFTKYLIDTNYEGGFSFKNENGELILVKKALINNINSYKLYKLDSLGKKFESFYETSCNCDIRNINDKLVKYENKTFYYFQNNSWELVVNTNIINNNNNISELDNITGNLGTNIYLYQTNYPFNLISKITGLWHLENELNVIINNKNSINPLLMQKYGKQYFSYNINNGSVLLIGEY